MRREGMRREGMVALVTGASSGIGAAIARDLAAGGASVALAARRRDRIDDIVADLPDPERGFAVTMDVADEVSVAAGVAATIERFGHLDVLVNNAGVGSFAPLADLSIEDFDRMIDVNLRGVFLATKSALPHLLDRSAAVGEAAIVTIASIAGRHGFVGGSGYAASKFGVVGMMDSLFREVRGDNVRVVLVNPGSVATDFFDDHGAEQKQGVLEPEDVAATVSHILDLPPRALVREIDVRPTNPG